jgi:hypothetical protein
MQLPELDRPCALPQLLRRSIAHELRFSCRLDSNLLCGALEALNASMLNDVRQVSVESVTSEGGHSDPSPCRASHLLSQHYYDKSARALPPPDSELLPAAAAHLRAAGIYDPLTHIYVAVEPQPSWGLWLAFFAASQVRKRASGFLARRVR